MRKSIFASLALAGGALLFSAGASAIPIHVGLTGAAGHHAWQSDPFGDPNTLGMTAWSFDGTTWHPATMVLVGPQGAQGLGVVCDDQPSADDPPTVCNPLGRSENDTDEIDSVPWQVIDMNLAGFDNDWISLTVSFLSVEDGDAGYVLFGSHCAVNGNCGTPTQLSACTEVGSCSLLPQTYKTLTDAGITDLWVTPRFSEKNSTDQGNVLLNVDFIVDVPVPEPVAWGVFGFGLLLVGMFAGLRRRRTH